MDPITQAGQAAQLVVDYGVVGAILLGASVIIAGLMLAVVVLWRAREASERSREEAQRAHYTWAVEQIAKQTEAQHELADALESHAAATAVVRDLLLRVVGGKAGVP